MSPELTSFADLSRQIASDYLHSVVMIDDEARFRTTENTAHGPEVADSTNPTVPVSVASTTPADGTPALDPNPNVLALITPSAEQLQAANEAGLDSHDLDAKEITDGFAKRGLVCAVLRPTAVETAALSQNLGVTRADIVVLDWVLHSDNGEATLALISGILSSDKGRLRLIAIYTGQNDLVTIADRLAELLQSVGHEESVVRPNNFTAARGPVRIAVFAKPKTRIPTENAEAHARIANSDELPERLIGEFAEMTSGLVSHVAVSSLAALRRNAQRIMRRLPPSLDAAYLWHRAMQIHPEDAQEHLRSIVVDEISAVLVDEGVDASANIQAISSWLTSNVPRGDYGTRFALASAPSQDDAISLLTTGASGRSEESKSIRDKFGLGGKAHTRAHQYFAGTATANAEANEALAMLLSLRSHYQPPTPVLTLGTLLRSEATPLSYWICVQPACDSVRRPGATAFPLLPLMVATGTAPFHVVAKAAGGVVRLQLKSKPLDLRLETFVPGDSPAGIVASAKEGQDCVFTSTSGSRYVWLAEMKPQHALWVANKLTTELGRVGLTDSEWLRRWQDD